MSRCLGEHALLDVLEGEPAERERGHLRSCAACRVRLRRLQDDLDRVVATLHAPPPVSAPTAASGAWHLALPGLALAALAALALLLQGGERRMTPVAAPRSVADSSDPLGSSGLGAALEGGDGAWSDWSGWAAWGPAADGDEGAALRAALHGMRPCALDERMLYAACDETALAGWSPALEGEEVGR